MNDYEVASVLEGTAARPRQENADEWRTGATTPVARNLWGMRVAGVP